MSRFGLASVVIVVLAVNCLSERCCAADWPQWRYDADRSACSPQVLPDKLHLQWQRKYPPLEPAFWQVRQGRVQFDLGYEPVVTGKTLVIGSSRNDRVTALDTETGAERWRFYADGPIRTAPTLWDGKAYFSSDDGSLYCLDVDDGRLIWKRRASPSTRKVIGNGRLISAWPARGGPVIDRGRVYFAAGVWPFEGIFVYALDAKTGDVLWMNDRCGSLYLQHPHAAMSFGGPSPQGYLLVDGDHLVVPSSRAFPAFFDLDSGRLAVFDFGHGGHGSVPGGWFVATDKDDRLVVDPEINTDGHDAGQQTIGQKGIRPVEGESLQAEVNVGGKTYNVQAGAAKTVELGGKLYRFRDGFEGVDGEVHSMLAADDKLFVVTRAGSIFCFGPEATETKSYDLETQRLDSPNDHWRTRTKELLANTGVREGYAIVLGLDTGRLVEELLQQSELQIIAIDSDAAKVEALRRRFDEAGLYGERVAVHQGEPLEVGLPPYLGSLVVSEHLESAGMESGAGCVGEIYRSLRPFGGVACLEVLDGEFAAFSKSCREAGVPDNELKRQGAFAILHRTGPPPGATDYSGTQNSDQSLKSPFGLLWFGDTFHHHKLFYKTFHHETGRGLPTNVQVVNGVMKYETTEEPYGPNPKPIGYHEYLRWLEQNKKYRDAYIDVYTGRIVSESKTQSIGFRRDDPANSDPGNLWTIPSPRRNPLTGLKEGRHFLKTYGCDRTPVDYGGLLTMRSGTAAFYDTRTESGTVNISGLRSGCRNSIVPACGVLSLPSWTGNCTCNYPVYTSLALAPMPERFEQWSAWGPTAKAGPIERIGINLGAPGDRATEDGTLWLDFPSVGGPSPEVSIHTTPEKPDRYYRHSMWMDENAKLPWVIASGVKGIRTIRIEPVAKRSAAPGGTIGIRWAGVIEPQFSDTYTFHAESDEGIRLWIGDKLVLDNEQKLRRGERGEVSGSVAMEAGVKADIRVEYYSPRSLQDGRRRKVAMRWSSPSVPKEVIPKERLSTVDGQPRGLTAAYYDTKFAGPCVLQTDSQIGFDWGADLPPALKEPAEAVKPHKTYTVELYFAEPENLEASQRVFSVALQGKEVLSDFDIVKEAGGRRRQVVRRFASVPTEKDLVISFTAKTGQPVLSGVRLIAENVQQ